MVRKRSRLSQRKRSCPRYSSAQLERSDAAAAQRAERRDTVETLLSATGLTIGSWDMQNVGGQLLHVVPQAFDMFLNGKGGEVVGTGDKKAAHTKLTSRLVPVEIPLRARVFLKEDPCNMCGLERDIWSGHGPNQDGSWSRRAMCSICTFIEDGKKKSGRGGGGGGGGGGSGGGSGGSRRKRQRRFVAPHSGVAFHDGSAGSAGAGLVLECGDPTPTGGEPGVPQAGDILVAVRGGSSQHRLPLVVAAGGLASARLGELLDARDDNPLCGVLAGPALCGVDALHAVQRALRGRTRGPVLAPAAAISGCSDKSEVDSARDTPVWYLPLHGPAGVYSGGSAT